MVAESLAKQEEEGILCSPTSQIENVNEEEMDTSISHYKRKVLKCFLLLSHSYCDGDMKSWKTECSKWCRRQRIKLGINFSCVILTVLGFLSASLCLNGRKCFSCWKY